MQNRPEPAQDAALRQGVTVVLTATIDPKLIMHTRRRDPMVRLNDYVQAFRRWITNDAVTRLVFCDNSGYDLSALQQVHAEHGRGKEVEFLSFEGQDFEPSLGKAYGELAILAYVAKQSRLVRSSRYLLKVTGRLYVSNTGQMIERISQASTVDVFCNLVENLTYSDSRVFACTQEFLEHDLLPLQEIANDGAGMNFEKVLARAAHRALSSGKRWSLLPVAPRIYGVGASFDQPYNHSLLYWLSREGYRVVKAAILAK